MEILRRRTWTTGVIVLAGWLLSQHVMADAFAASCAFTLESYTCTTIDVPGATSSSAFGINDTGQIVGGFIDAAGEHGFLRDPDGTFRPNLVVLGRTGTLAFGINNAGQIVGRFFDAGAFHGFLLDPGRSFTPINVPDVPGSSGTLAFGINNAGQIVGSFVNPAEGGELGFFRGTAGGIGVIGVEGATFTEALGITDAAQIVGRFGAATGKVHSFLRDQGRPPTPIDDVPGSSGTLAFGINNASQISGSFVDAAGKVHGFLRGPDGTFTPIDVQGASFTFANGITDAGQIVGRFGDATGTHGFLATPRCQVSVTRLGQCRIFGDPFPGIYPWASDDPYAFHDPSEGLDGSICKLGCALTSLSMALISQKVPRLPDCPRTPTGFCVGAPVDKENNPGNLNVFMNRGKLLEDYTRDFVEELNNNVNWDVATRDVGIHIGPPVGPTKYYFDYTGQGLSADASNSPPLPSDLAARKVLDNHLCAGRPVVVRVTGADCQISHHKVLVVGKEGDGYVINDPAHKYNPATTNPLPPCGVPNLTGEIEEPRHERLSEYGLFDIVGAVVDPADNMSGLNIFLGTNADLLVVDNAGRRTGLDTITKEDMRDIPQSAHLVDATDDELTGAPPRGSMHLVNIFQPLAGTYEVIVTGLQLGSYALSMRAYSQDGSPQPPVSVQGFAGVGSTSTFEIQFNPSPGSVPQLVRSATFSSTLADINNALQLGLIDNQGIANSLASEIQAASDALSRGQAQATKNILGAFRNEVSAQTGKHITGVASQVLRDDAASLLRQIP